MKYLQTLLNVLFVFPSIAMYWFWCIRGRRERERETREEVRDQREKRTSEIWIDLMPSWSVFSYSPCGSVLSQYMGLTGPHLTYGLCPETQNSSGLMTLSWMVVPQSFSICKALVLSPKHAVLLIILQFNQFLWGVSLLLDCSPPGWNTAKVILTCCFNSPIGCLTVLTSIALVNSPKLLD